jgi:hypothetical protein
MLGIFRVFQAPGLGRVFGAVRNLDVLGLGTVGRRSFIVAGLRIGENANHHQRSNNLGFKKDSSLVGVILQKTLTSE